MIILKDPSKYLENKMNRLHKMNRILIIFLFFCVIGAFWGYIINNIIVIGSFLLLMKIDWMIYKKSRKKVDDYRKGIKGEQAVINALKKLDDKYYLINDITLQQPYGNIDHILLGPNDIFVIETKNYEGTIECNGDEWHRHYERRYGLKDYSIDSPSKQVKRNAVNLKKFLSVAKDIFNHKNLFINGIIVFTEPNIDLNLNNPTVPVLRTEELRNYIENRKTNNQFTKNELESMAKSIIDASK